MDRGIIQTVKDRNTYYKKQVLFLLPGVWSEGKLVGPSDHVRLLAIKSLKTNISEMLRPVSLGLHSLVM